MNPENNANLLTGLQAFDWAIVALYATAMLFIGWRYSRKTKTSEDYLLGGRTMRPWTVGLSLFASLLSTISYLAGPGEMIRYGPVYLAVFLAYPPVILVVGWFVVPVIMRSGVTTAYEILETRLGAGPRTLGAVFFLSIRFIWMAVIVYATASKVLIPMMGWSPTATPYVCAALGGLTVIYTAMGGLRAVVLTDVLQTFILFGGAVLTLGIVTFQLGGVGAWFPTQWPSHWPDPVLGYDPEARMSVVGVFLAALTWYVCTSASDQIAIQRYLSTKDLFAARRTLIVSICADALSGFFLGMVGLALLAYFQANPGSLPEGASLVENSDRLFPHFIVTFLPRGIGGLVIAGLLAAAMSSLSSGINSASSVITVDFLDRFVSKPKDERTRLRRAIAVSFFVGAMVIGLSAFVGAVPGNLLEMTYKTSNLLVAPLAGLFFLAILVPWANSAGAFAGALASVIVVVCINYWEPLTGVKGISFIWGMPLGLATELSVGMVVSAVVPSSRGKEKR